MIPIPELTIGHYISGVLILLWIAFVWSADRKYEGEPLEKLQKRWWEFKMNFASGAQKGLNTRKKAAQKVKSTVTRGDNDE